jgi:hypothetical protein
VQYKPSSGIQRQRGLLGWRSEFYHTDPAIKLAVMPIEGWAPTQVIDSPNIVIGDKMGNSLGWTSDGRSVIFPALQKGVINLWVQPVGASNGKPVAPRQ